MMEQLAERRMQREEEANAAANGNHPMSLQMHPHTHPHTHAHTHSHGHPGQPEYDDEEDYDEEDEESEEDDYDEEEEDEQDTMTEEQRMEEGRRMFQIFAARMFEQRVLTAYREKVARERQQKLLEELEEENRQQAELEQKRALAKDRQKEKKRLQKLAKEEEAKRKAAEKAAEDAERKEQEARKAEEQRKRKEEQRLKREAEKKAALEEKQRQEEERKRRVLEEREREAERERKKKEHQEREKKRKEEQARKAKEEKEAREKEARERKEREDRERKEREAIAKKEAEEQERARQEQENKVRAEAAIAAIAARTIPSGQSQAHSKFGSPHLSGVSPAIPQTGALGPRPRNSSQQDGLHASQTSSPKTPSLAPRMGSGGAPSTPVMSHLGGINMPSKPPGFNNLPGFPPTSPLPQNMAPPPGVPPPEGIFGSMSPISMGGQMGFMPGMGHRPSLTPSMPGFPPSPFGAPSPSFRGFAHPVGQPLPVSSPSGMQMPIGAPSRPFMDMPTRLPPGVPIGPPASPFANRVDPVPLSSHNRAPSGGFEPISRPTPIQRPSSVAPKHIDEQDNGVEAISKVMGSRALLEDDDVMPENVSPNRRSSLAQQYAPRPIRTIPMASPIFSNGDVFGDASWSNPRPLGGTSGSLPSTWANPGAAWADMDMFNTRRRPGRHNQLRLLACTTYRDLAGPTNQFIEVTNLEHAIHSAAPDLDFTSDDLTAVLEAVGDASNGGGNFIIMSDATGKCVVALETMESVNTPFSVGEIGSPRIPGAVPFRQQPFAGPRPFPSSPAAAGFTSFG
ncbi:hypothetical protein EX30DRAFT_354976 [Ascodesmis nigricans]|uniref:Stress response protein NST1 n=1 Tax=Ascodesmis nigricans TaxID=341454 RepID=A0A4S2MXN8_9PEZI|nr:hypothetical protein EX30DRAFT_354976 [Ascodesmis nigricans]